MSADFDLARRQRPLLRILEEDGRRPDRCPICEAPAVLERSGRFPEAWVDRIGESVDLEILARELGVGGPAGLKRSGNSWVGECPLCRGDAFNLTPKKGIWKCFKCDASGGSIRLVEVVRNIEFPEAVRYLAQRAGIPIEYENERQRLRCGQPGCAASKDPLDEVGYLMHARQLSRPEACVVWLQEAGVKRGETHSPSLMMPGCRKARWNDVIADGREGGDPETTVTAPDDPVASPGAPAHPGEPVAPDAQSGSAEASSPAFAPQPGSMITVDQSDLPRSALREFWIRTRWTDADATGLWKKRGLSPHTGRIAGLRSNDRANRDVLKGLATRYPIDVLVEAGLWQRYEPDGPAWLQSESEAGVETVSGSRPSEFFYGKGQTGTTYRGRTKIPVYGWNNAPIIAYWEPMAAGSPGFLPPKGLVTEGEFKALAVWQVHGVSPIRLAAMPDPSPDRLAALRPHKHWPKGATALPYLCPDGDLPLRVAAVPGITFCRAKGGAWTVRYHLDAWLRSRGIREVMVAYDNEDRVSRWRCPECGNTDIAISQAQARQSAELPLDQRAPRGVRTGKPNCCGKPMKENPGFKQDEWSRWDSVIYALLLGQELEKLGIDARFMLIPDEMRDPTSGKVDWDSALARLLFEPRQSPLPIEPTSPPSPTSAPEADDLPDAWRE